MTTSPVSYFALPGVNPSVVIAGPDGNLWVGNGGDDYADGSIDVIGLDGTVKETFTGLGNGIDSMAVGSDGNVWFTQALTNAIGMITPAGVVTEYPVPDLTVPGVGDVGAGPALIIPGPDGALYFSEPGGNSIGKITTSGVITQFPTPGDSPDAMTFAPDGTLYFGDENFGPGSLHRLNADGTVTDFDLTAIDPNLSIESLTTGPDGAIWFTDGNDQAVGRVTTGTDWSAESIPIRADTGGNPTGLAFDASGDLWVTTEGATLVRVTPQGVTTAVSDDAIPTDPDPAPDLSVTLGPDGALWFIREGDELGRADPTAVPAAPSDEHPLTGSGQTDPSEYATTDPLSVDGPLATFYDGNPAGVASDFTATIQWGDGTTSPGTVVVNTSGGFDVDGKHTYGDDIGAPYPATITITDVNPTHMPQPNTLTLESDVSVSSTPNPVTSPPGNDPSPGDPTPIVYAPIEPVLIGTGTDPITTTADPTEAANVTTPPASPVTSAPVAAPTAVVVGPLPVPVTTAPVAPVVLTGPMAEAVNDLAAASALRQFWKPHRSVPTATRHKAATHVVRPTHPHVAVPGHAHVVARASVLTRGEHLGRLTRAGRRA